jgi:RNA polymerase sigma factor, sigma-70 family
MPADLQKERARLAEALSRDRRPLVRFARARLSEASELDPEDVVADVVAHLFERADLLAQVENLTAYLFRAVGNSLIDLFRRRRVVEELSPERADPAATPEQMAEQAQLRRRLDGALEKLSPPERAVWVAVEVEGATFRELALRWGEPLGTLLSRKNRATRTLRKLLAADGL